MLELINNSGSPPPGISEGATLYGQITRGDNGNYTSVGAQWGGFAVGRQVEMPPLSEYSYGFSPLSSVADYNCVVGFSFNFNGVTLPLSGASLNLRTPTQVSTTDNVVIATLTSAGNENRLHIKWISDTTCRIGISVNGTNTRWTGDITRSGYVRTAQIRPYWAVNAGKTIRIYD